ncbi:hypothetical protein LXL04_006733 [Taraxacum kok-saghyz]
MSQLISLDAPSNPISLGRHLTCSPLLSQRSMKSILCIFEIDFGQNPISLSMKPINCFPAQAIEVDFHHCCFKLLLFYPMSGPPQSVPSISVSISIKNGPSELEINYSSHRRTLQRRLHYSCDSGLAITSHTRFRFPPSGTVSLDTLIFVLDTEISFEIDVVVRLLWIALAQMLLKRKKNKTKHVWNTESSTYFVDLCLNELKKGNKPSSHLNKTAWLNLKKCMLEKTGKFFYKKQLSNKWEGMKRDWKLYDRLMRLETGIGGTRSLIDASEEWWAEKINVNKDFAKFKDTNLDIYATPYAPLFQDSVAVGDHTMTPLQFQDGENMVGKGDSDEINLADEDGLLPSFPEDSSNKRKKSSGQKRTTESKSSYEEKLDVVLEALSTKSTQTFPQNTSFPTLEDCMPIVSSFPGFEEGSEQYAKAKFVKMSAVIIKPDENYNQNVPDYILNNPRYYPIFKDFIGAIDGTHVKASVAQHEQAKYIGRKGYATQNIMVVCDFNMCFTFVWAGWEGTTHDTRIFNESLQRSELHFPRPMGEKYYVVDAGYPNTRGYLAPYKGATIRYHLPDFQRTQTPALRAPSGAKETFNFRHSSLRNIIERTFGVWKARWAILRDIHVNFTYDDQVKLVLASMAMHNYIRKSGIIDETFNTAQQESYEPTQSTNKNGAQEGPSTHPNGNEDSLWMAAYRDMIAEEIMNTQ